MRRDHHPDPLAVLTEIEQEGDRRMRELTLILSAAAYTPPRRSWWRRVRRWFNRKETR